MGGGCPPQYGDSDCLGIGPAITTEFLRTVLCKPEAVCLAAFWTSFDNPKVVLDSSTACVLSVYSGRIDATKEAQCPRSRRKSSNGCRCRFTTFLLACRSVIGGPSI